MNYCAFDIEIVKSIPEGQDWKHIRPLGISCAATIKSGCSHPDYFYHGMPNDPIEGAMNIDELQKLVSHLLQAKDCKIVTWNGLGFDFDVLAEEYGEMDVIRKMALNHIDMMFHFFCVKGYMVGLNAVAKGLGLPGKTEGMHGDLAPIMWAKSLDERKKVVEYVGQDAITTLQVAEETEGRGFFKWTTKSGNMAYFALDSNWLTVNEALKLPEPDQSWMNNPKKREDFLAWMKKSHAF